MPSLRFWQHAAYADATRHRGALSFSTGTLGLASFHNTCRSWPCLFADQHAGKGSAEVASQVIDLANDKEYADALAEARGAPSPAFTSSYLQCFVLIRTALLPRHVTRNVLV